MISNEGSLEQNGQQTRCQASSAVSDSLHSEEIHEPTLPLAQRLWRHFFQHHDNRSPAEAAEEARQRMRTDRYLTDENRKNNIPWGNTLEEKDQSTMRIYSNNVNGFQLDKHGGSFDQFCELLKEINADVACLQEHNLDISKHEISICLRNTAERHFKRSKVKFSHTQSDYFLHSYKPGGTAMIARESIVGRHVESGADEWGRWTFQVFIGTQQKKLWVFSLYQVVNAGNIRRLGASTASAQQVSLLRSERSDYESTPRQAFKADLETKLMEILREPLNQVILLGDFNEIYLNGDGSLREMASDLGFIDIMRRVHPTLTEPATYARGSTRVDYILGTEGVAEAVQKCGFEPFYFRFDSDHRAMFVDLDCDKLFGNSTQQLTKPVMRGLHSSNKTQVTQYILRKHELLSSANAFARAERLKRNGDRNLMAEKLDRDIVRASLVAEKGVTKFGTPMWSRALADARRQVLILKLTITQHKTGINLTDRIESLQQEQVKRVVPPSEITECQKELVRARQLVENIVKDHYQHREAEREERIQRLEAIADRESNKMVKVLKHIRKAEAIKKMFTKLRGLTKPQEKQGITRLEVPVNPNDNPKTCQEWKILDVPTEILTALQDRNRSHFGQAHGTPFTVPPLQDHLNFDGVSGPYVKEVLSGTYDIDQIPDESTRQLLSKLSNSCAIDTEESPEKAWITAKEVRDKLKVWAESTSTSPSKLHLGHYKTLISDHKYTHAKTKVEEALKKEIDQKQRELLDLHVTMMNYALSRGYSYTRWQTVANTMILKEVGNFKIHRTRVIHIYEADYNLILGVKWRKALHSAESKGILNSGQFGSRPSRNAHDPVFIELLQREISIVSRRALIQTNYDATSCYDRIIPNLAAVVSQKFGVPSSVVLVNTKTLEHALYKLKTELGISETGYQHCTAYPIFGTGQGSGNSPIIWCFVSSILFDCYQERSNGAYYESPDKMIKLRLSMVGFVDDSNGQTNLFLQNPQPTASELVERMRDDAQLWSDLLWSSGGALELSKCSYQILHWEFGTDGTPKIVTELVDEVVPVMNPDGTGITDLIPQLEVTKEHKTLGTYQSFSCTQARQLEALQDKCDNYRNMLSKSFLNQEECWTFYFAIFLPSVGYPLPTKHFSKQQLDDCERQVMRVIFSKCGYNRNTKREILFGSTRFGGGGFRHLYTMQGIGQVMYFIRHWRDQESLQGRLLRILMSWIQMSVGVSFSVLEDVQTQIPHLESKWIASLRSYLGHLGATLELDNNYVPRLERNNDFYIMEEILKSEWFSPKEIRILNYCRLYLGVTTGSDLTTASGRSLHLGMLQGRRASYHPESKWLQVEQARPSLGAWKLWKRANSLWSTASGMLYRPMSKWVIPINETRFRWQYYVADDWLFVRESDSPSSSQYTAIPRIGSNDVPKFFAKSHRRDAVVQTFAHDNLPPHSKPVDALPVSIHMWKVSDCGFQFQAAETFISTERRIQSEADNHQATGTVLLPIPNLKPWERYLMDGAKSSYSAEELAEKLSNKFYVASDGSVLSNGCASFGWIMANEDGKRLVKCSGPVQGSANNSYRAEGVGILSALYFLVKFAEEHQISFDTLVFDLGCDNKAIIGITRLSLMYHRWQREKLELGGNQSNDEERRNKFIEVSKRMEEMEFAMTKVLTDTLRPEWDIICEIHQQTSRFRECSAYHVKGHQNRKTEYAKLSLMSQLNVDADSLATSHSSNQTSPGVRAALLPNTCAHLHTTRGTVTSRWAARIRAEDSISPLKEYIRQRNGWSSETVEDVNWTAHGTAMGKRFKRQAHFVKLVHDILPTFARLHRFDKKQQPWCPLCGFQEPETRDHLMQCRSPEVTEWREEFRKSMAKFHQKQRTEGGLKSIFTTVIFNDLLEGSPVSVQAAQYQNLPEHQHLILNQERIGWRQVFSGRLTRHWDSIQCRYIQRLNATMPRGKQFSGTGWTAKLIDIVWESWWKLWEIRNQKVHGVTQAQQQQKQHEKVIAELCEIYENRNNYEPRVQDMLFETVEEHSQHSYRDVHNWLAVNRKIFQQSATEVQRRAIRGVRSIRMYFQHTHAPPWNTDSTPVVPSVLQGTS
jgi:exonuclease III